MQVWIYSSSCCFVKSLGVKPLYPPCPPVWPLRIRDQVVETFVTFGQSKSRSACWIEAQTKEGRREKKIPLEPSKHSLHWSETPPLPPYPPTAPSIPPRSLSLTHTRTHTHTERAWRLNPSQPSANPLYLFPARWGCWNNSRSPMSSIQFVMPSKGACKLPICSYVIVTMGGSVVLGLNYRLIAVVEIKPPSSRS